jgi:hypothetical protein
MQVTLVRCEIFHWNMDSDAPVRTSLIRLPSFKRLEWSRSYQQRQSQPRFIDGERDCRPPPPIFSPSTSTSISGSNRLTSDGLHIHSERSVEWEGAEVGHIHTSILSSGSRGLVSRSDGH